MLVYHFMESRWALNNLEKMRLKVARIKNLNDPFDCFVHIRTPDLADHRNLRNKLNERYGLLCFSKTYRDPVQWAHYAAKHSGVALGFEVNDECIKRVEYRESPRTVYFSDRDGKDDEWDEVFDALCDKYSNWQYEQEWRLIIRLEDTQTEVLERETLHFKMFDGGLDLKEVIIGAANETSPSIFLEALNKNRTYFRGVKVFKANINEDEYKVQKGTFIECL